MAYYGILRLTVCTCTLLIVIRESVEYELMCPEHNGWKHRAKSKCGMPSKYFCLLSNFTNSFVEGCDGPKSDREGRKYFYNGGFIRTMCSSSRYQPVKFKTQEESRCVLIKSLCSEIGQVSSNYSSLTNNSRCYCDSDRGFHYIPRRDSETACDDAYEDCSCYQRNTSKTDEDVSGYNVSISNKTYPLTIDDTIYSSMGFIKDNFSFFWEGEKVDSSNQKVAIGVMALFIVKSVIFLAVFINLEKLTKICCCRFCYQEEDDDDDGGGADENDGELDDTKNELCFSHIDVFEEEELYYLILVHFIFRVACVAVRVEFKNQINEQFLKMELTKNQINLKRRLGNKLSREAKRLLWPIDRDVSVDSFDIRLMILLLNMMTDSNIVDRMPLDSDRSVSSMLARIKFVRNYVTLAPNGSLDYCAFKQHWKHTVQAAYQLLAPCLEKNDVNVVIPDRQLVGRLETHLNLRSLSKVNVYTERILRQVVLEFCKSKNKTMNEMLDEEKHTMCHKRTGQKKCCTCPDNIFSREITDVHWDKLFCIDDEKTCSCDCENQECANRIKVKNDLNLMTFDCSLLKCLIFNMPSLSRYVFTELYTNNFKALLIEHKHKFYHACYETNCCECKNGSVKSIKCFTTSDFQFLFKKNNCRCAIKCKTGCCNFNGCQNKNCCCKFTPKRSINVDGIDDNLLHKIIGLVKPFSVVKESETISIEELYKSINSLKLAAAEFLDAIKDTNFKDQMNGKGNAIAPELQINAIEMASEPANIGCQLKWAITHVNAREHITGIKIPGLVALYQNLYKQDSLCMKKEYLNGDTKRTSELEGFIDLDKEENNFLLVFYVLQQIVCPEIKEEFQRQCKQSMPAFEEVVKKIKDSENNKNMGKKRNKSDAKENHVYMSKTHLERLDRDPSDYDLKLLIILLKELNIRNEVQADSYEYLENINSVRKCVMTNSCGKIPDDEFNRLWGLLEQALVKLNPDYNLRRLDAIKRITNIFELTKRNEP